MKLILFSGTEYSSTVLPEKPAGQYWVRGKSEMGKMKNIVAADAMPPTEFGGSFRWVLKSNRRFSICDGNGDILQSIPIKAHELYMIKNNDRVVFTLYAEPLSDDRKTYTAYEIKQKEITLVIGLNKEISHIRYENKYTGDRQAELIVTDLGMTLKHTGQTNKTYVNGKSIDEKQLKAGDSVYIMGLQIIVTPRFLFINNPDNNVCIDENFLQKYNPPEWQDEELDFEDVADGFYYREPRKKYAVDEFNLKIDPPTNNEDKEDMPMLMMVGPSMTMGMAAATTGAFAVMNAVNRGDILAAVPALVMSVSMLCGTLLWPVFTKRYQKRKRIENEAKRQTAYTAYLEEKRGLITAATREQEKIRRNNDVGTDEYIQRILAPTPQIWERTPRHTDFLSLRLGTGSLPLEVAVECPARGFSVDKDNLLEDALALGEEERLLQDVPVCLPITERFVSGFSGSRELLIRFAKKLILQLVALHSYDEVKLVMIYDESDEEFFAFTRFLPHTMDNERTVRYIATNTDEIKELSSTLDLLIEERKVQSGKQGQLSPYFAAICMDKELSTKAECISRVLEYNQDINFAVISMFEKDLPKECSALIDIKDNNNCDLTFINNAAEKPIAIKTNLTDIDTKKVTNVLANTYVEMNDANLALPKVYTFFEMLNIGMIEHLDLVSSWETNDPTKSLAAAIGIDKYGGAFKLDLHENAHGPHGLIAGMTGSGKSEFIIAYILSMMVTYSPEEVAFILIDYKGGGMAAPFRDIPHTAGVITNLDGANSISRSLSSLRSELHRRERIFTETSAQHGISNIDIYKYQKLRREGKVDAPLPHLFLISDEFAELQDEQPEFMNELTSAARVGRSLGVHLILATQKPSGVVNDQINSNARFRVCLKVQDGSDSSAMIGRTDAAMLRDTGRFYLLVGNNELFDIGQSAWAGAPYYPSPTTIIDRNDAVSAINTTGRVLMEANTNRFAHIKDPDKQFDVILKHIKKICAEEDKKHWKILPDKIPASIYADELEEKYKTPPTPYVLNPTIGELDDPSHQIQEKLCIPITEEGNVIVYGSSGSGKEMLIEAMCYSLMTNHRPEEVNLYILDFGTELLTAFAQAPHVGDVILSHESEKIENLLKLLIGKIDTRKKTLSQTGSLAAPNIVVIINNYAAFTELYDDYSMTDLKYLMREGTKYNIYFMLACTGVHDVRFALLQNFKTIYCLQLNNADDYAMIFSGGGLLPEKYKGRGLAGKGKDGCCEFQTARITREESPYDFIRAFSAELAEKYPSRAESVPILPETVTDKFLSPHVKKGDLSSVPIGVDKETLEIVTFDFTKNNVNLVISINDEWEGFVTALGKMVEGLIGIKTVTITPESKPEDIAGIDEPAFVIIKSPYAMKTAGTFTELFSLIESCENEQNIRFALVESYGNIGYLTNESRYKKHVNANNGIWIGSGISTQFRLFNITKFPPYYMAETEVEPNFGYVIKNSKAEKIKFLSQTEV